MNEQLTEVARYYELRWAPESYYPGLRVPTMEKANAIVAAVNELLPGLEIEVHEIVVHDGSLDLCARGFIEELGELTGEFYLADYAPADEEDPHAWAEKILHR